MSSFQKMDVSVNIAQDFSDAQKKQGRDNIGTNRVVFVTYGTSTQSDISDALSDGDSVILQVPATGSATYVPLSYASSAGYKFRSPVSSSGAFAEYSVSGSTWTTVQKNLSWVSFTPDTLQTTEAKELFTIGDIEFGYYFDSAANFRISMRSTSGTRYVYLADQHGTGGGYALTTSWTAVNLYGFSNSNQLEHVKGYDTTGSVNLDFDVYYANGVSPFVLVAQYRVNT